MWGRASALQSAPLMWGRASALQVGPLMWGKGSALQTVRSGRPSGLLQCRAEALPPMRDPVCRADAPPHVSGLICRVSVCDSGSHACQERTVRAAVDPRRPPKIPAKCLRFARNGMARAFLYSPPVHARRLGAACPPSGRHRPITAAPREDLMDTLLRDARHALRSLRKSAGFSLIAVFTLALGIGASTAMFTLVNSVLLRPIDYRDPDCLVMLWERNPRGRVRNVVSPANFFAWREQATSFTGLFASYDQPQNLTGSGEPEEVLARLATDNFFEVLGTGAQLGRPFVRGDEDK